MSRNEDKPKFDLDKFKEYVNTYDIKKNGLNNDVTILKDMIYGLGISMDSEKYSFNSGFKKFISKIKNLL